MKKQSKAKITYDYGTGRRKTAAARVFIRPGSGNFTVNDRPLETFFSRLRSQIIARQALQVTEKEGQFDLLVTVRGGGESGQAEAVRHGIARALVQYNPELKTTLRTAGLITRDSRAVERKKVGLRKARRSRQYSKR
ncbi:MAG: 30S ribosomal protein S9 [Proteobacteria bacterium]|nr:30S ribosomal protein S9 [Pseudomonadota bacterium]MCH9757817.1 30S ribosomal protein S9 [Pseudomonadota bacterium]